MNFLLIDAFADRPFAGNPAAVVLLERAAPEDWLQRLAMEFNQAETAYVLPRGGGGFDLRWFTPLREVPLCGHATLAAARAIAEWRLVDRAGVVRFITRQSGELRCTFEADEQIAMDFPATPPAPEKLPADAGAVLGVGGAVECIGSTAMNLTLRVADQGQVIAARPDLQRLAAWHPVGVTITAAGDEAGVDFVSRFFAPAAGVDEDPVTGSAHCALAVYWAKQLGKTQLCARQLSKRGGRLDLRLMGDRVQLRGRALVTARGTIDALY
jgi:PhzF family phenazine biosynthesis protein